MSAPVPADPAPPQPPLRQELDSPPMVVNGIGSPSTSTDHVKLDSSTPLAQPDSSGELSAEKGESEDASKADQSPRLSDEVTEVVRPGDLAAFAELFARFQNRVEKAAAGRKYRPLREAWEAAAAEIFRAHDRIDLEVTSENVVEALRLGCESGKVVVVDACLDFIHRLFEYGHIGSSGDSTEVVLDAREGALDDLVAMVCSCLEVKDEDVYLRMVQTLLTASTRTRSGLHHGTLLAAVRTIYNIFLNARTPGTRTTARVSLTQILNLVFSRMEAETAENAGTMPAAFKDVKSSQSPSGDNDERGVDVHEPARPAEEDGDGSSEFATVLQKDAYLLFRALCKLSAKDVADDLPSDNVGVRSKLLSLELLRSLVSNSGPAFRSGDRFIYALRQYLTPSLLNNCMSGSAEVMDVSFDIFEMLLRKDTLRPLLKTEIGALFETVIFRFLESATAGPMRKRRAITLLNHVSGDRQTMADLFLNYDCDLDSTKIFERIVNVLSGAAEDKTIAASEATAIASTPGAGQVDSRVLALTSVVQIVRSLRNWSKPIEDSKGAAKGSSGNYNEEKGDGVGEGDEGAGKDTTDAISPVSHSEDAVSESDHDAESRSRTHQRAAVSGGLVLGTVSEGSDRDTAQFEEALKAKRDLAEGITLFNAKPKRGIDFLVSNGRLKRTERDVAEFLRRAESLDASMVGEYLGEGKAFNIGVMHAYTDLNDFAGQTFDGALRMHLSGFRLPGEAQKIDRIMEKFASRFCDCNPGIFANADAAYVLAYSAILLHTDAHNDTIKNKMSKEDFIKNNRGINDGGDLDPEFLGGLYDRIRTTEIRLVGAMKDSALGTDGKALNNATSASMDPAQRARKFQEESERLMAQTKVLFANKRRTAQDYTYYSATNVHHARLMFESAWYSVLAAISLNLEEASPSDTNVVALCLDGFRNGIAIASTFGMSTSKDAFVSSLAKFTHLNNISEMRPKNVECVRMILAIAALEGNNLGEQWLVIVRAISQLEQIRAVAGGNPGKYLLQKAPLRRLEASLASGREGVPVNDNKTSKSLSTASVAVSDGNTLAANGNSTTYRRSSSGKTSTSDKNAGRFDVSSIAVDPKTASLATTIEESEIERIFTNSSQLTSSGVADFCGALCTVALEELTEAPTPRLFCLQKIVEMAYYNMESRTRFQWGKIWVQMGPFFASAMCHVNRDVAMYSVDALRQLASKFLDKDELSNFSFQKSFLKPFEVCFSRSKSVQIRELVLTCISQIVLARAANIKSGWRSVFAVLALAADDKRESVMNFGWQIVDSIVRKYVGVLDDVFVDAVTGIAAYSRASVSTPVSLAAISTLSGRCASSLANGRALSVIRHKGDTLDASTEDGSENQRIWFSAEDDNHIGAWFPVLTGLASAIQDERAAVRMAANDGLYKVLTDHGGQFSPSLWALIFRGVLGPVFDDVTHLSASSDREEATAIGEWATTTGSASIKALVDVFVLHFKVARGLLRDLLTLIRSWILQEIEVVAREGMSVLARLIMSAGGVFSDDDWRIVVNVIGEIFVETMPHEILGPGREEAKQKEQRSADEKSGDTSPKTNGAVETTNVGDNADVDDLAAGVTGASDTTDPGSESIAGRNETAILADTLTSSQKIDFTVVRAKCVVQLLLIQLVQEIVVSFYRDLSTENILSMSESLEGSYTFAHNFNVDIELRYSLWRTGFMNQVPNLLKQETNGLMAFLRISFWLYLDPSRVEEQSCTEDKVIQLCEKVLSGYTASCHEARTNSEDRREVVALSPVITFIVNGLLQMSDSQFGKHLSKLYGILLDLLDNADDGSVRRTVTELFRMRIKPSPYLSSRDSDSKEASGERKSIRIAKPQLPGAMRERFVHVQRLDRGSQSTTDICAALNKVAGVRSVMPANDGEDVFCVVASAPEEMLIAGITSLPQVKSVTISTAPDVGLD